jgi:carbamoyl-phosphate synthase small subunit
VVLDFGVKKNILLELQTRGLETIILPGNASLEMILKQNPAGVVLSNGPGDPRSTIQPILPAIKGIIDLNIPLMGICLGFQLIGLALGGIIKQLVCGHHGTNHPIYDLKHKRTYISSQNHEFHLLIENIPSNIRPSFISLFDKTLEGFYVDNKPIIAVQFHPESNPGPHDCSFIFNQFKELVEKYAKAYGHK